MLRTFVNQSRRNQISHGIRLSSGRSFVSTASICRPVIFHPTLYNIQSSCSFSTDAVESEESKGNKKESKAKKTWLQVWTDLEFRNQNRPLEQKLSKNNLREKARMDMLRCVSSNPTEHTRQIRETEDIYVKFPEEKEYIKMTYREASVKAKELQLDLICFRDVFKRPPVPERMRALEDDGIPVFIGLDYREYVDNLHDMDTTDSKGSQQKEVKLTDGIGSGDLDRKALQALDFLFEGDNVKITCKSKRSMAAKLAVTMGISKTEFDAQVAKKMSQMSSEDGNNAMDRLTNISDKLKLKHSKGGNSKEDIGTLDEDLDEPVRNNDRDDDDDDEHIPHITTSTSSPGNNTNRDDRKLTKKELEILKQREALAVMRPDDKIAYAAMAEANITYDVLWQLVEYFAGLAAVVQFNRMSNQGKPLIAPVYTIPDNVSKKELRKLQMIKAAEDEKAKDPLYNLRYEVNLAREAINKGTKPDPELVAQTLKKNPIIGYDVPVVKEKIIKNNFLSLKLVRQK